MPGTVSTNIGPRDPTHIDQKMAGFSIDAHRRYRNGWEKNRGTADMMPILPLVGPHSLVFRGSIFVTHPIDRMRLLPGSLVALKNS